MLLRGGFLFEVADSVPVRTFAILHPQIEGLFQATRPSGWPLWTEAIVTVLKRLGWATLRPFLKALFRRKASSLDDQLAAARMVGIETNHGRLEGNEVVFADGVRRPLVTAVVRHRPFTQAKLVLFPHFEPDGGVSHQDLASLRIPTHAGYDTVVLSTNLGAGGLSRLGFVNAVVVRPNVGHDFFSRKVAFHPFEPEIRRSNHLLLLNNSVFLSGPRTLAELDGLPDGFGCLLDSPSAGYHTESSCVVVHQSKQQVILAYEIGLSRFFLDRGFPLHAVRPYEKLVARVMEQRSEYPELAALLAADPVQSSCTTFREYLIDEGFTILKKRKD